MSRQNNWPDGQGKKVNMKKVIMHKFYNPDRLFGGYGWSIGEVWDDWNCIYSTPYYVEIPDDFSLGESVTGEKMYFKDGCRMGYELHISKRHDENSNPLLIGGSPVEIIDLNVLGLVPED